MLRKRKWCHSCNQKYRGKYTICNPCVKQRHRDNRICWECKSPDCVNPVLRDKDCRETSLDAYLEDHEIAYDERYEIEA